MGIEKTKERYLADAPAPLYGESKHYWVCLCDLCRKQASDPCADPGRAATAARVAGFETRPGPTVEDPRIWVCPDCQAKPKPVWYTPDHDPVRQG